MLAKNAWIDHAVAFLVLSLWTLFNVSRHWGHWDVDMSAVYLAARFVSLGEIGQIYAAPPGFFGTETPPRWAAEISALGFEGNVVVPYAYPPIWTFLLSPIAGKLGPIAFFDLTRTLLIAAYAAAIFFAWKLQRPSRISAAMFAVIGVAIAEITIPVRFAVLLNQPQLLIVFLSILAFERYISGRHVTAGVILGLAAAIKITPVFLCLIFLLDRNVRATLACLATVSAVALASLFIAGLEPHLDYLDMAATINSSVPVLGLNTNMEVFLHRLFIPMDAYRDVGGRILAGENVLWITVLGRMTLLVALIAAIFSTYGLPDDDRIRVRLFLFSIAFTIFGPLAWVHYYMLPVLLLPGLISIFPLKQAMTLIVLMVTFFSIPMTFLPQIGEHGDGLFQLLCVPAVLTVLFLTVRYSARLSADRLLAPPEPAALQTLTPAA